MLPFEDETTLSLLFHLNSEPWANIEAYQSAVYEVEYKELRGALLEHDVRPLGRADELKRGVVRAALAHWHDLGFRPQPFSTSASAVTFALGQRPARHPEDEGDGGDDPEEVDGEAEAHEDEREEENQEDKSHVSLS